MSKFQVGDRVRVFGHKANDWKIKDGTVTDPCVRQHPGDGMDLRVKIDDDGLDIFVHPKQCRKLVKKERRRFLVTCEGDYALSFSGLVGPSIGPGESVEFIEVRKKK